MLDYNSKRKYSNLAYFFFASLCFLVALIPLISILYYTIVNGASVLSLDFFTKGNTSDWGIRRRNS